ncbi:hypothetical protein RRG08_031758 [Elysia crispata]|uniref:Uncharacterized protein n=1 Tax=Elysia crispata TaxID=231223 RepID=A0AAE1DF38_9GAST|nr:hypothetical protein RRG08_031758 [Elysia crispata]
MEKKGKIGPKSMVTSTSDSNPHSSRAAEETVVLCLHTHTVLGNAGDHVALVGALLTCPPMSLHTHTVLGNTGDHVA